MPCFSPTISRLLVVFGLIAGCQDPPKVGPVQSQPEPTSRPCEAGYSVDPPRADARPAERLVKEQRYAEARKNFDELLTKYPESSNLRVWRGDADLFDEKDDYLGSAERALAFYKEARRLDELGCKLSPPERYYAALHITFTHLRKRDAAAANNELHALEREYPESAEVKYHLARAACLSGDKDLCYQHFERTLALAHARSRPKFLRTHYSVADWIRRSETQSELGPLRKDPRYRALVTRMANEN
jgi:tetratricopeptide (TPR) repeat protein